jgi:hypothetical protein
VPNSNNTSLRQAALIAGLGLVAMTIFAVVAIYEVFPKIIVPGDAAMTVSNLVADKSLFRTGIACLIVVAILDVLVAWALYIYLKPVDRSLSLLAAWFRLVYSTILCFALFKYVDVLYLVSDESYLKIAGLELMQANVMLSINAFDKGWGIGLVFFGLHLALTGYLILRSNYIPKFLGIILVAAGLAYIVDNMGMIVLENYDFGIAKFIGWGELLLMVWLLYKGGEHR